MTVILVDGGNTHEVWVPLSLRWTWPVSGMQHTDGQTFQCNQLLQKSGCCWVHVWLLLSWCLDGLPKGLRLSLLGLFATWQSVRLCTGGSCMSCKLEKLCLKLGLEKKMNLMTHKGEKLRYSWILGLRQIAAGLVLSSALPWGGLF